jgi:hypothetical protein
LAPEDEQLPALRPSSGHRPVQWVVGYLALRRDDGRKPEGAADIPHDGGPRRTLGISSEAVWASPLVRSRQEGTTGCPARRCGEH